MDIEKKARKLIVPAALPGRVMQELTGTAEQLIERGRIDAHRRMTTPDGIEIDTWVIKSRTAGQVEGAPAPLSAD